MRGRKKYFTEEERKEAKRRQNRRYYYTHNSPRRYKVGRLSKKALYSRRCYWEKKAVALGFPAEEWENVFRRQREMLWARYKYYSLDREEMERRNLRTKKYVENHKDDPNFIESLKRSRKKWYEKHKERSLAMSTKWQKDHRDVVCERMANRYADKKRSERGRLLMAIGG